MPETLRLFIASHLTGPPDISLSNLTQSLGVQLAADPLASVLRWTPPEQRHLTWQFLGDTPREKVPLLQAALNSATTGKNALTAQWRELSWWPSKHRPQILVALLENNPALQAMAERIAQATATALHPPVEAKPPATIAPLRQSKKGENQHAFKPHITLARLKDKAFRGVVPNLPEIPAEMPDWRIDTVTLFQSELHATGAIHTPILTVQLPTPPVE
jgi:2'-5' RNA ligase